MIIHSKLKLLWPAFGFAIQVGQNENVKLPEKGKEQIKRRLAALAKAGLVTFEKPEKPEKSDGSGDVQNPVSGVSTD